MQTYLIVRRRSWSIEEEVRHGRVRATAALDDLSEVVTWMRSYVVEETDGTLGSICIYGAVSPEALRRHAAAAELPVDEIVRVNETVIVRPDSIVTTT